MQDLVKLVDIIPTLEDRTATKELSEDATYGPDVDRSGLGRGLT